MTIWLTTDRCELLSELSDVIRVFYPGETISFSEGDFSVRHAHTEYQDHMTDAFLVNGATREFINPLPEGGEIEKKRLVKRSAKTGLFIALHDITGFNPPWGSLTGIRPTRLLYEFIEEGLSPDAAREKLEREFFVSGEKATLLTEIRDMQAGLRSAPTDSFDLYIGIPFCATRCLYCSFSAGEIGRGELVEPYVKSLLSEIEQTGEMLKGMRVRSIYIGGGTPTSIPASSLARIMERAVEKFPGSVEFTVEAGRPDTIDREKLDVIRRMGATRISVNPQTFSDDTLRLIGRAHTSEDTLRAYSLAREMGFDDINMDVIAALPGEKNADFSNTMERVISLSPESVTVHTLAIKHASRLREAIVTKKIEYAGSAEAGEMVAYARKNLTQAGYAPYYLYRQKYMAQNLENVGYAKPGKACLYNIGNMEETARVLALGAGAITKWIFAAERRIDRAPNLRDIREYTARVDEMVERKRALIFGERP